MLIVLPAHILTQSHLTQERQASHALQFACFRQGKDDLSQGQKQVLQLSAEEKGRSLRFQIPETVQKAQIQEDLDLLNRMCPRFIPISVYARA